MKNKPELLEKIKRRNTKKDKLLEDLRKSQLMMENNLSLGKNINEDINSKITNELASTSNKINFYESFLQKRKFNEDLDETKPCKILNQGFPFERQPRVFCIPQRPKVFQEMKLKTSLKCSSLPSDDLVEKVSNIIGTEKTDKTMKLFINTIFAYKNLKSQMQKNNKEDFQYQIRNKSQNFIKDIKNIMNSNSTSNLSFLEKEHSQNMKLNIENSEQGLKAINYLKMIVSKSSKNCETRSCQNTI